VVTPALAGIENARHLPNASTLCGRCEEVCPMRIPLPRMLRHWREKEFERHLQPASIRWGLKIWAYFALRPRHYRLATSFAARILSNMGFGTGRLAKVPMASGWTEFRDFPAPQGKTFQTLWKERRK
jgi:L-lactate dehydrogenase complex protein LldF